MSQLAKLEASVRANVRAARLPDLLRVLEGAGFTCRRGRRGHWVCVHLPSGARCNVPEPHGGGESFVRPTYVRDALQALDESRQS